MTSELVLHQLVADRRASLLHRPAQRRRFAQWRAARRARAAASPTVVTPQPAPAPQLRSSATPSTGHVEWASVLGHVVAEHGIASNDIAVHQLLRTIEPAAMTSIHADIVADRTLPDPIRERAFGQLLVDLANTTTQRSHHAAA